MIVSTLAAATLAAAQPQSAPVDHSKMGHSKMDHSKMDHGQKAAVTPAAPGAKAKAMDCCKDGCTCCAGKK